MADKKKEKAIRHYSAYLNELLTNVMLDDDIPKELVNIVIDGTNEMLVKMKKLFYKED